MSELTAFILAGGHSMRMGRDKAFIELHGRTLLAHAISLAKAVISTVQVVAPQEKFLTVTQTIEDIFPECGPLGGIHAALKQSTTALNLMLAVDLPFIEPKFLSYLAAQASQTDALVTVPQAGGGWQPLCAVYRREFAEVAEQALRKKKYKIDLLFTKTQTRVITEQEIERMGFSSRMFQNLNTPDELLKAEAAFKERRS